VSLRAEGTACGQPSEQITRREAGAGIPTATVRSEPYYQAARLSGAAIKGQWEAFAAAWAFIREHAEAVVVYYSKYERTVYRDLQAKYPEVCGSEEIEALFSAVPERSFDLYYDAVRQSEWPTMDYSVRTLAKFCGFQWRDLDPSGASSIQWFDEWVRTRDPAIKQRILDYNEDDCVAMRVVLDRMRGMSAGVAAD
jgi:predicted RecB family nuclease